MINLDAAKVMLDNTTHLVIRSCENFIIVQRFKMNDCMLQYNHVTTDVFIDTLFSENKSKRKLQFTCNQVFGTEFGYNNIFPMKSKVDVYHAMKNFLNNIGVPQAIIVKFVGE